MALAYLTWLGPSVVARPAFENALARAARAFPVIGAGLGAAAGLVYVIAYGVGLPPLVGALAAVAFLVLATAARHEAALARLADGLGAAREPKAEDAVPPRLGAAGVIVLMLALGARIATIADLESGGLVFAALLAAGASSRAALAPLARYGWGVGEETPAEGEARSGLGDLLIGVGIALVLCLVFVGWSGLVALILAAAAVAAYGWFGAERAAREDTVLGAQQVYETVFLIALSALR